MEALTPTLCYHIYNHANGFENIFAEDENYRFFLEKYVLYISPIAETYAYCLMPNHFHLVIRIRQREHLEALMRKKTDFSNLSFEIGKIPTVVEKSFSNVEIEKFLSKQFSNLFSSYTQSFNKFNRRMGSLFMKNFKRELISSKEYFQHAIIYTHRNPIHHGFCGNFTDWNYSSYSSITSYKNDIIEIDKLLKMLGTKEDFIRIHSEHLDQFKNELI